MFLNKIPVSLTLLLLATLPALGQLRPGDPAAVGMSRAGLDHVAAMLDSEVRERGINAASIVVARRGTVVLHKNFGHLSAQAGSPPVGPDSVFVVGSITKTVTATALMILVERGQVSLNEPVSTYLPEFTGGERNKVRVINLLTHTSGLPDQLPENDQLRQAHAPISEFLKHTLHDAAAVHTRAPPIVTRAWESCWRRRSWRSSPECRFRISSARRSSNRWE